MIQVFSVYKLDPYIFVVWPKPKALTNTLKVFQHIEFLIFKDKHLHHPLKKFINFFLLHIHAYLNKINTNSFPFFCSTTFFCINIILIYLFGSKLTNLCSLNYDLYMHIYFFLCFNKYFIIIFNLKTL